MKIAVLGPFYPFRGGISYFLELLANTLKKKNAEIKIFNFINQYPDKIFPGKNQFETEIKKFDFPIKRVLTPYNPLTWNNTTKEIIDWKPDLLILKYWIPFFALSFGYIISKIKKKNIKIKIFYIIDNIDFHEKWFAGNLLTRYALKKADALVVMSDSVKKDAKKLFPDKKIIDAFHPIYVGYNKNRYSKISARKEFGLKDEFVLLFFGFIKKYKGLDNLIKAFSIVRKKYKNTKLLIAGEVYGNDAEYIEMLKKYSLKDSVIFKNEYIAESDVEKYFKASDVLVLPYKHATQSGILNIAYDMNLPTIATPTGSLSDFVGNAKTGIICKSISPVSIAEAVIEFINSDKMKFIENIKKEKKKYSWERFSDIILEETKKAAL